MISDRSVHSWFPGLTFQVRHLLHPGQRQVALRELGGRSEDLLPLVLVSCQWELFAAHEEALARNVKIGATTSRQNAALDANQISTLHVTRHFK